MKLFQCDGCGQVVYFESARCERCGRALAFLPEALVMSALEEATPRPPPDATAKTFRPLAPLAKGALYRLCRNYTTHAICNWGVADGDTSDYCKACRLTRTIPNLADDNAEKAKDEWHRLEIAKRRLLYTLFRLGLPVESKTQNPEGGLAFDFLADGAGTKVFTGHSDGLITVNIAEADDPFREKLRKQLGEGYRTVLGHLRHESGHYYWERLIADGPALPAFRALFGDERQSYEDARKRHYGGGPPAAWWEQHVSAYATMHPWEDWAETWAHYLHMVDGLETARTYGLSLRPNTAGRGPEPGLEVARLDLDAFADLVQGWIPLTVALNNMNRSFGMGDCYPFVLSPVAVEKIKFVHDVVHGGASARYAGGHEGGHEGADEAGDEAQRASPVAATG